MKEIDEKKMVRVCYTNWVGDTSVRTIQPCKLLFTSSSYHPREQWLLDAYDCGETYYPRKLFALADIHWWKPLAEVKEYNHDDYMKWAEWKDTQKIDRTLPVGRPIKIAIVDRYEDRYDRALYTVSFRPQRIAYDYYGWRIHGQNLDDKGSCGFDVMMEAITCYVDKVPKIEKPRPLSSVIMTSDFNEYTQYEADLLLNPPRSIGTGRAAHA